MLDPRDRCLLLESLRPPDGYTLDHAVGTSFSLDLLALLVAPLAFTLFAWEDRDGRPEADPYSLLAALRENASRITLFCQGGQIGVPRANQLLISELEDSVFEVAAPKGGVFHPKVWLLRFVDEQNTAAVIYRFLCLSRNLTFDRCWDVVAALDGDLTGRTRGFASTRPLSDFIAALPGLASAGLPDRATAQIDRMAKEVRRVRFDPPGGFERLAFWPLGLGRATSPFDGDIRRILVVSPFLSAGVLDDLNAAESGDVLVSRIESLEQIPAASLAGYDVRVLDDAAVLPETDPLPLGGSGDVVASGSDPPIDHPLRGLHAKVYVADAGWNARMWLGSANATTAAFEHNVEFLVELEGKKSRCGIDACLGTGDDVGLEALLMRYEAPAAIEPSDPIAERLERLVDRFRRDLAACRLEIRVKSADDSRYALELHAGTPIDVPKSIELRAWPSTAKETAARLLDPAASLLARFDPVPLEMVTPFIAFRATAHEAGRAAEARFVLRLSLQGAPQDRRQAILRSVLSNRAGLIRFLIMMLGQAGSGGTAMALATRLVSVGSDDESPDRAPAPVPLLELLIHTLERDPHRLVQIRHALDDLCATPDGREMVGDELLAVWEPIWSTYKGMSS